MIRSADLLSSLFPFLSIFLLVGVFVDATSRYGVDISFPMKHDYVSTNYEYLPHNVLPNLYPTPERYHDMPLQPLGNRQRVYNDYIDGCVQKYKRHGFKCLEVEQDRISMNRRQPQYMVNYTELGFHKTKVSDHLWSLLVSFWERNQENWKLEAWPAGNTFTNHWEVPTYMVSVEDSGLRGGGQGLKTAIWETARTSLQEWTGQVLTDCSLYGIRVYTEDAMLNSHVDRLPQVFSTIINIAQDVDEPWPLEVIGHDGVAYNITMDPGDMILYESHSVIHGRPFPLRGRFMANLFVHFEPIDLSMDYHGDTSVLTTNVKTQYRQALQEGTGGHEAMRHNVGMPPYLLPETPDEISFQQKPPDPSQILEREQSRVHTLAAEGRTAELIELIEAENRLVNAKDNNGWTPLHEGARGGHIDVVKFLVGQGADFNERSQHGSGGTPMFYAQAHRGKESVVFQFFESIGAVLEEPDTEL